MGMCHSFRSRLLGSQSALASTGFSEGESGQMDTSTSDPQRRERLRLEERARAKAERKRSRRIDSYLRAEMREYLKEHRLLLLGKL